MKGKEKKKDVLEKLARKNRKINIQVKYYSEKEREAMIFPFKCMAKAGVEISYPKKTVSIDFGYIEMTKEKIDSVCTLLADSKEFNVALAIYSLYLGNSVIFTDKKDSPNKYYVAIEDKADFLKEMLDTSITFPYKFKTQEGVCLANLKPIGLIAKAKKENAVLLYYDLQDEKGKELFEKIVDKSRIRNKTLQEMIKEREGENK